MLLKCDANVLGAHETSKGEGDIEIDLYVPSSDRRVTIDFWLKINLLR